MITSDSFTAAYLQYMPHQLLSPYVRHYFVSFPQKNPGPDCYTLVPDATSTLAVEYDGKSIATTLWGVQTTAHQMGSVINAAKILFLIEFKTGGLYHCMDVSQKELLDLRVPFSEVNNELNSALLAVFEEASNLNQLVGCVDALLIKHLQNRNPSPDLWRAASNIVAKNGAIKISDLSRSVAISDRHLSRLFQERIGMSTVTFRKLIQINAALELLKNTDRSIVEISDSCGYYDQSHFEKNLKSIAHTSIGEYRKNTSDFYNTKLVLASTLVL